MRRVDPTYSPLLLHPVFRRRLLLLWALSLIYLTGCGSTPWLVRTNSLAPWMNESVADWVKKPLRPSERTTVLLRRLDLQSQLDGEPEVLLSGLQHHLEREQSPEVLAAYAEIAFLAGQKIEPVDRKRAFDIYAASVAHAYLYLFDPRLAEQRNEYDPQFRFVSSLYNNSLDRALRIIVEEGRLQPGSVYTCNALNHTIDLRVVARNVSWRGHDVERFEFVSDFETTGIVNTYRTYGLGVPLIAIRKRPPEPTPPERRSEVEKFYPDTLALPVTAFLRLDPAMITGAGSRPRLRATLELIDPLVANHVNVARRPVPIESDLTTPIAYGLDHMQFDDFTVSTFGMLQPETAREHHGLFMMEPYQPNKIPVVLVHGLWSSPVTWVEMFNDLRGDPTIRARYQFWYYFYPTGQPFLYTGATLRRDLAQLRRELDPHRNQPALDQMVLVGHSMGGLVSKLQAVDSGDEFWDLVADKPFHELQLDDETREQVAEVFYFRANPGVRRVVTIATPHEGSQLSNSITRWLARTFFSLPQPLVQLTDRLKRENSEALKLKHEFDLPTSIDTLSPDSPALVALRNRPRPPWVTYNNIYGEVDEGNWFSRFHGPSDGVVPVPSAQAKFAATHLAVPAEHQTIHRHPKTVLEMRRILRDHLAMLDQEAATRHAQQHAMWVAQQQQQPPGEPAGAAGTRWEIAPGDRSSHSLFASPAMADGAAGPPVDANWPATRADSAHRSPHGAVITGARAPGERPADPVRR